MLSEEIHQKIEMHGLPPHVSPFPEPRELRVRVLRLLGLVIWREYREIALPAEACYRMHAIASSEFNAQFPSRFRVI